MSYLRHGIGQHYADQLCSVFKNAVSDLYDRVPVKLFGDNYRRHISVVFCDCRIAVIIKRIFISCKRLSVPVNPFTAAVSGIRKPVNRTGGSIVFAVSLCVSCAFRHIYIVFIVEENTDRAVSLIKNGYIILISLGKQFCVCAYPHVHKSGCGLTLCRCFSVGIFCHVIVPVHSDHCKSFALDNGGNRNGNGD